MTVDHRKNQRSLFLSPSSCFYPSETSGYTRFAELEFCLRGYLGRSGGSVIHVRMEPWSP